MANSHALEENTRDVIDPLISNKEACAISISTGYGSGPDQIFLDSPNTEWLSSSQTVAEDHALSELASLTEHRRIRLSIQRCPKWDNCSKLHSFEKDDI